MSTPLNKGTFTDEQMFAGLGIMVGGGAADDKRLNTEEFREARERERDGGLHLRDVRAVKMGQYNSESRAPQYVS